MLFKHFTLIFAIVSFAFAHPIEQQEAVKAADEVKSENPQAEYVGQGKEADEETTTTVPEVRADKNEDLAEPEREKRAEDSKTVEPADQEQRNEEAAIEGEQQAEGGDDNQEKRTDVQADDRVDTEEVEVEDTASRTEDQPIAAVDDLTKTEEMIQEEQIKEKQARSETSEVAVQEAEDQPAEQKENITEENARENATQESEAKEDEEREARADQDESGAVETPVEVRGNDAIAEEMVKIEPEVKETDNQVVQEEAREGDVEQAEEKTDVEAVAQVLVTGEQVETVKPEDAKADVVN